ncbi:MAG TPA: hypothetical protein VIL16_11975, partial [Trebonia sp.]
MNSATRWLPAEAGQAGGERSRRCPGAVTGAMVAGRQGRSQGQRGRTGRRRFGGTRGGAVGGAAGGWLKEAAI